MNHLIKKAFTDLYPDKKIDFDGKIKYSKAFKGYNANVKYTKKKKEFRLSYKWKKISDEIQIGLIQSLLNKIYDTDKKTINIELYEIFLKKIPTVTPKTKTHPILEDSFNRMNEKYLNGMIIQPNLEFAGNNFSTLGTYDYGNDTIRISKILKKDQLLLDYVMYHEMLHKKFQYQQRGKKTIHHSREFRKWEKKFHPKDIEKKLTKFLRKERLLSKFRNF